MSSTTSPATAAELLRQGRLQEAFDAASALPDSLTKRRLVAAISATAQQRAATVPGLTSEAAAAAPRRCATTIAVRGATTHFDKRPSYVANITQFCRARGIRYVVISTSMAAQGIKGHLQRLLIRPGDAQVESLHCFLGDEEHLDHALTGKPQSTPEQKRRALVALAIIVVNIRKANGPVLIMCAVGRNRSFTAAFFYYVCFYGVGKSVSQCLDAFKAWRGVDYDRALQGDGCERLYTTPTPSPWLQSIGRMFHSERGVVSRTRVDSFLALATQG